MRGHVGVVGAGLMGCGIAARLAQAGHRVTVWDSAAAAREQAPARWRAILEEQQQAGVATGAQAAQALERLRTAAGARALADCACVVEAVVEVLAAKQAVYRELESVLDPAALIASSTSGFTPGELAQELLRPGRFLVAHFWNPPHLLPLVEVVAGADTEPAAVEATMALLREAGCEPVLLHKAVPGFVGNRFQFAVLREALHLLREGVADAQTLDRVMTASLGRRWRHMGPLASADAGGLQTFLAISRHLMPRLAKDEDVLAELEGRTARGELGMASGRGFHAWDGQRLQGWRAARLAMLREG